MQKQRHSFSYTLFFWLVRFGLKIYLGRWKTIGNQDIPKPALFTSNHQNALMDTLVITTDVWDRQLSFIARSDIFKGKLVGHFLGGLNMLPIFRPRDKVNIVEQNQATFSEVIRRLKAGGTVKIFPEGNHGEPRRLRSLKKGFARMAFWTEEAANFKTNLHIVPIGTYYKAPQKIGTDVLVQYGEPIAIAPYEDLYKKNKAKAIKQLTRDLSERLKPLMIHIESKEHYETIELLRKIVRQKTQAIHQFEGDNLFRNFKSDKHIITQCEHKIQSDEATFKRMTSDILRYKKGIDQYRLADDLFEKKQHAIGAIFLKIIGLVILLPVYIYAFINSILPYFILKKRFLNRVKDPVFYSTIAFTVGLFLFPIVWVLQSIPIAYFWGGWMALIYVLTMPFVFKFGLWLHRHWQVTKAQYRYNYLSRKPEVQQLKQLRKQIIEQFLL